MKSGRKPGSIDPLTLGLALGAGGTALTMGTAMRAEGYSRKASDYYAKKKHNKTVTKMNTMQSKAADKLTNKIINSPPGTTTTPSQMKALRNLEKRFTFKSPDTGGLDSGVAHGRVARKTPKKIRPKGSKRWDSVDRPLRLITKWPFKKKNTMKKKSSY